MRHNKKLQHLFCFASALSVAFLFWVQLPAFGFEFKGFSDITFTYTDNKQDTTDGNINGSFAVGQFDLYLVQSLGDRIDVLSEIVIEGKANGEMVIDLERLQIEYLFSDALIVRAGRFHNILGYWNTAYHHGTLLYTTIQRPEFLEFEDDGGVLPVHLVGLWLGGRLSGRLGSVEYGVMVGNGPKISGIILGTPGTPGTLDPNSFSDNNKNKALSFHLRGYPAVLEGLGIGLSGNFSEIQFFNSMGSQIAVVPGTRDVIQEILGADLIYQSNNLEILSEVYQIRDHGAGIPTYLNYAWYVQGGYKLMNFFTPYGRFERLVVHEDDPYFVALGTQDMNKTVLGLRYDIIPLSSLKAEVRLVDSADNYEEYAVQWAFAF